MDAILTEKNGKGVNIIESFMGKRPFVSAIMVILIAGAVGGVVSFVFNKINAVSGMDARMSVIETNNANAKDDYKENTERLKEWKQDVGVLLYEIRDSIQSMNGKLNRLNIRMDKSETMMKCVIEGNQSLQRDFRNIYGEEFKKMLNNNKNNNNNTKDSSYYPYIDRRTHDQTLIPDYIKIIQESIKNAEYH